MFGKIILSVEILAAVFGVFYFYKYRKTALWPWLILLLLAPTAELIGEWYSDNITYNNHVIFNIYDVIHTSILFKIIYDHIIEKTRKRLTVILYGILIITLFVNVTYDSFVTGFLTLYKSTQTVVMILALATYLIDVLKRDTIVSFKQNLPFFVFSGYLLFQVVYLPIYFTYQYIVKFDTGEQLIFPVLHTVHGVAIVIFNLLFIFGLIWTHKIAISR